MKTIQAQLSQLDWSYITQQLNEKGYALVHGMLSPQACDAFISHYPDEGAYRKTVCMERYRFGAGEYKYFEHPLPVLVQQMRAGIYSRLVPLANHWMKVLNIPNTYPPAFETFRNVCHSANQTKSTVLILKYGPGGHNALHQDMYGEVFFPIQAVLFLNAPHTEYKGGEFILVQQTPRAQSRATVLQPGKGDMLLFTSNFRPVRGSKGYYKARVKHGVSEVREGERYTLGIVFHDALS